LASVYRFNLHLADKADWVKVFDPRDSTIFVSPEEIPEVGESIRIDLEIDDSGPHVILRGKVISRREEPEGSAPAGCSVALSPDEREKVNYLNGFVRGGLLNLRETRRLPLRLPVTYGGVDGPCKSFTRDVNEEGVFIISEEPLPEESEIHVLITFPREEQPLSCPGRVSHTVVIEDEDIPGMGVVFAMNEDEQRTFDKALHQLEADFLVGKVPEALLL
jgi:Tfp pilus assembly protein PilZ